MFSLKKSWAVAFALLVASPLAAFAAPHYTLTFLPRGFEPGPFHAINNSGDIVGTYQGRTAIFGRSGIRIAKAPPSIGQGINDHRDVSGFLTGSSTAFAIIRGKFVDIHATLPPLYFTSDARGINDRGSVTGTADPFVDEAVRGYLYRHGRSELIPTLGGDFSFATALNNKDMVVGWASTGTGSVNDPFEHAFIYKDGKTHDLGTLDTGQRSEGFDINDRGQAVGWSRIGPEDSDPQRPFLFQNGRMIDLGSLGGTTEGMARSINNKGVIVGESSTNEGLVAAFLFTDHKMLDLNKLTALPKGWRLQTAQAINDKDQILATACRGFGGECASVRLDPVCACRASGEHDTGAEALSIPEREGQDVHP